MAAQAQKVTATEQIESRKKSASDGRKHLLKLCTLKWIESKRKKKGIYTLQSDSTNHERRQNKCKRHFAVTLKMCIFLF